MKKRLIITSVGSLVGQNVLDTLHGRREHVLIICTNSIVEAANNFRCDKAYLVPPAACTADYVAALCSLIANERPDLVIPGRDDDIVILADLKAQLPAYSESLLVGSGHFARVMDDKVKSYAFARQYELPFSPTLLSAGAGIESDLQQMVEVFGFPLIAKPVAGNPRFPTFAGSGPVPVRPTPVRRLDRPAYSSVRHHACPDISVDPLTPRDVHQDVRRGGAAGVMRVSLREIGSAHDEAPHIPVPMHTVSRYRLS